MRTRIFLTIFLSIFLIGTASWMRFLENPKKEPSLTVIEKPLVSNGYEDLLTEYLGAPSTNASSTKDLTNTDLIGRQLINDYFILESNGQASNENISLLTKKYVDALPNLINVTKLTYTNLISVPNTRDNFTEYAQNLAKIQIEYAQSASQLGKGISQSNTFGPKYYAFASSMAEVYKKTALKLKNISVPSILVEKHLELINNYLSSAEAISAITKTERDPASAFAGIVLISDNINMEEYWLKEIKKVLNANGV